MPYTQIQKVIIVTSLEGRAMNKATHREKVLRPQAVPALYCEQTPKCVKAVKALKSQAGTGYSQWFPEATGGCRWPETAVVKEGLRA